MSDIQIIKLTTTSNFRFIFDERELTPDSVIQEFLITVTDGKKFQTKFYNLNLIFP